MLVGAGVDVFSGVGVLVGGLGVGLAADVGATVGTLAVSCIITSCAAFVCIAETSTVGAAGATDVADGPPHDDRASAIRTRTIDTGMMCFMIYLPMLR